MVEALALEFMQNAVMAAVLVSLICGIIGSLVVVNKMSFIAGGIAHGAYGGIGLAFFFSFAPLLGAGAFSLLLALIIATISFKDRGRLDSIIGAIWAFGMALGIVLIDLTPGYNTELMSYLFGSILAVSHSDIIFMSFLYVFYLLIMVMFYRQFIAISFDMEFARLRGVSVRFLYYLMICMMALCVVAMIRVVGLILVIALLSIPPLIAQQFTKSLGLMMIVSSFISLVFCFSGLWLSFAYSLTSGASIILVASLCFFMFCFKFRV